MYACMCVCVCVNVIHHVSDYTDPLQRVNRGMVLSSLQVFGEKAVGDRGEFLIARVSLAFVPGIAHLRDAQPFFL